MLPKRLRRSPLKRQKKVKSLNLKRLTIKKRPDSSGRFFYVSEFRRPVKQYFLLLRFGYSSLKGRAETRLTFSTSRLYYFSGCPVYPLMKFYFLRLLANFISKNKMPELLSAATIVSSLFIDLPEMENNSANKFFDGLAAGKPLMLNYGGWQSKLIKKNHL